MFERNILNKYATINLPQISFLGRNQYKQFESCSGIVKAEAILESMDMGEIFQRKGKTILEKGKISENFKENVKIWKYFEKGQMTGCDNRTE